MVQTQLQEKGKIRKVLALLATVFLLGGAAAAFAAVTWPSTSTSWQDVNNHLNALHQTDLSQANALAGKFSKVKVVTEVAAASGGNAQEASVRCPDGWTATGGGYRNDDADWYAYNLSPTFPMGPTEIKPNGWSGYFSNPTYVEGTPFPIITLYAVCAT